MTVRETIATFPDEEFRGWLNKFFGKNLDADPIEWYGKMGMNIQVLYKTNVNGVKFYLSADQPDSDSIPIYVDSFGGHESPMKEKACLLGIFSKLAHNPHWYESYIN